MKKLFLAAAIAVSAVAIASTTSETKPVIVKQSFQDTIPGKKDTATLPKRDTITGTTFQLVR